MKEEYDKLGIIFTDTDSALKEHPELFKKYFSKLVPPTDNKFASLNSAFWSGGTFIYVPKGVKVDIPLQTYFRINNEATAQFERTLIIVDKVPAFTMLKDVQHQHTQRLASCSHC